MRLCSTGTWMVVSMGGGWAEVALVWWCEVHEDVLKAEAKRFRNQLRLEGASVPTISDMPSSSRNPTGRKRGKLKRELMIAEKKTGDGLSSCCRRRRS